MSTLHQTSSESSPTLVGLKRNVVKSYILVSSNLLPALANVGSAEIVVAATAETHASEEEEETVSQTL